MVRVLKYFCVFVAFALVSSLLALFVNDKLNNRVFLTEYTFKDEKIPQSFDGSKFLVISDLHNADFSDQIIQHIEKTNPEFVVIAGDMVQLPGHSIDKTLEIALAMAKMNIPLYAVSGNHDRQCGHYDEIVDILWANDVYLLENGSVRIEKGNDAIQLVGIKDPRHDNVTAEKARVIRGNIEYELSKEDLFSILLSHRADLYPEIKDIGVDLIISGHLHGGIIRLPFLGGIIGKEGKNGFLPDYEYGVVKEDESATMIVCGGADKNPKKRRYFNPPEILLITLKGE